VRSDGVLLGLTYIPEHQVAAWHQHRTDGFFESVAAIPEGDDDALYAVIQRDVPAGSKRYIERQRERQFATLADSFIVDSGLSYDGTNAGATTMTLTGATWDVGDTLTVTASAPAFAAGDVGNAVVTSVTYEDVDGEEVTDTVVVTITAFTSTAIVEGTVDRLVPVSLRAVPTLTWGLAVDQLSGFWHLAGETVSILGDGAVFPQQVVSSQGVIALSQPVVKCAVGLPITADLQTLPMVLEIEAFGQGTNKNVNTLHVRVVASSSLFAGPSFDKLRETKVRTTEPYGSPPNMVSGVVSLTLDPSWSADTPVCIRQSNPLPLTVSGLVPDTAIGG
jgi:hypothetical protein